SMTGHGRATAAADGRSVTVEARSVNHRYLDVKLRGALDAETERRAVDAVRKQVDRGVVSLSWRDDGGGARTVRVDVDRGKSVHAALADLAAALGSNEPVSLALVAAQPGVLVQGEQAAGDELFLDALNGALAALVDMRTREGDMLSRELAA